MSEVQSSKSQKRMESKKRKIKAFLEVAKLNDDEKEDAKRPKLEEKAEDATERKVVNGRLTDKPLLEGEEYEELKKRLKERKKLLTQIPDFRLKSVGELANVEREKRTPLFMSDIQSLLLYCICGDRAPYQPHRWCTMQKWNRLTNIICLVLDGVGLDDFTSSPPPWMVKHLPNSLEVVSPSSYQASTAAELALLPLSGKIKENIIKKFGSLESALERHEVFKAFRSIYPVKVQEDSNDEKVADMRDSNKLRLLLSATQMIEENYPIPLKGELEDRFKDYVLTKDEYEEVHLGSPMFSVDCEMCYTLAGMELTRICVVNEKGSVVYHSLVKPHNDIVSYVTKYSGITSEMLENVETRLEDVQQSLRDLLPPDAILVGQSLNSDLSALRMSHPYIIDTSVVYNLTGDRRRKSKLSVLAHLFLNKQIQDGGKMGHNPEEDALAAMNLVLLKLDKGYEFGDVMLGGLVPEMTEEGVNVVPEDTLDKRQNMMTSIFKTAKQQERTVAIVADHVSMDEYEKFPALIAEAALVSRGNCMDEVVKMGCDNAVMHNLTICHANVREETDGMTTEQVMGRVKKIAKKMFGFTSQNGMFMLVLGGTSTQNAMVSIAVNKPDVKSFRS